MTRLVLGIDPGVESGAAVLLSGHDQVSAWWTWCRLKRKGGEVWRVTHAPEDMPPEGDGSGVYDALFEVAEGITQHLYDYDWVPCELSLERLFVPRPRRGQRPVNPQSVIPLAESRGELIGGLRMRPDHEPLATEWRWRQLSLSSRTRHDKAEQAAIRLAPQAFTWPDALAPPTKAERGALAEASFIARDGWVMLDPKPVGGGSSEPGR